MTVYPADDDTRRRAAEALRAGRPVVIPTDTVYGLAVLPHLPTAIADVFTIKRRPASRSLAVLVADRNQAASIATVGDEEAQLMDSFWPGALTLVLQRRPEHLPDLGAGDGTIGVRCPAHPFVRLLAADVGPLATTSANLHGEVTPSMAAAVDEHLDGQVEIVVDGGELSGAASTVARVVITPDNPPGVEVFRPGPVTEVQLLATLRG